MRNNYNNIYIYLKNPTVPQRSTGEKHKHNIHNRENTILKNEKKTVEKLLYLDS